MKRIYDPSEVKILIGGQEIKGVVVGSAISVEGPDAIEIEKYIKRNRSGSFTCTFTEGSGFKKLLKVHEMQNGTRKIICPKCGQLKARKFKPYRGRYVKYSAHQDCEKGI